MCVFVCVPVPDLCGCVCDVMVYAGRPFVSYDSFHVTVPIL
jgi:hypothetical protein